MPPITLPPPIGFHPHVETDFSTLIVRIIVTMIAAKALSLGILWARCALITLRGRQRREQVAPLYAYTTARVVDERVYALTDRRRPGARQD